MTTTITALQEIVFAQNAYRSALMEAAGYTSGKRIYNLRVAERRLRELLWTHRDDIEALIRERLR